MTGSSNILAGAPGGSPSSPPDWGIVLFDVSCARCGHDLRGQTEPVCPACRLEFDWSTAVPIEELTCRHCDYHLYGLREERCPECGERFTWEEALADHYRRKKPLFEYRWRHHPLRSFILSWRLSMYPGKLWRLIDIHDPVRVGPLMVTVVVATVALFILSPALEGLYEWSLDRAIPRRTAPRYFELPLYMLGGLQASSNYVFPLLILAWTATSLGALMVFRQSMRLCRVRTVHVLRVWVYSVVFVLMVIPLFKYVCAALYLFLRVRAGLWTTAEVEPVAAAILLAFVVWSLRQGYKLYLHMPHSLGVAVASQIIAILAVPAALDGVPRLLGLK